MAQSLTRIVLTGTQGNYGKIIKNVTVVHDADSVCSRKDIDKYDTVKTFVYSIKDPKFIIDFDYGDSDSVTISINSLTEVYEIPIVIFGYYYKQGKLYKHNIDIYDNCDKRWVLETPLKYAQDISELNKQIIINGSYYDLSTIKEYHSPTGEGLYQMCKSMM